MYRIEEGDDERSKARERDSRRRAQGERVGKGKAKAVKKEI